MRRLVAGVVALSLASCGWLRDDEPRGRRRPAGRPAAPRVERAEVTAEGNGAPRTVILAVLDTVRADHTSLCGHDRPTTPTLDALAKRPDAAFACRAYSAAPWTHPSHASLFTGKPVHEHAAIWVTESDVALNPVTRVRPLDDRFETLAEAFQARGYQTVAVSANVILTPASGLLQGFDQVHVSPGPIALRGRRWAPKLREVVAGLDPSKPLFLFLNLYDAHDPYPAVPEGQGWIDEQPRVDLYPNEHDATRAYFRYVKGLSDDAEAAPFLADVRDGYDWGVHEADANLGDALRLLEKAGWMGDDVRLAVTSDHGEALGEHRLLRHGGFVVEPMTRVPLVLVDPTLPSPPVLPSPVSNVVVHDWLLTGRVPELPVEASAEKNERDVLVGRVEAAVWGGDDKGVCRIEEAGRRFRIDLAADPGESRELPWDEAHGLTPRLTTVCAGVEALGKLPPPKGEQPGMTEALRAVGYVE